MAWIGVGIPAVGRVVPDRGAGALDGDWAADGEAPAGAGLAGGGFCMV